MYEEKIGEGPEKAKIVESMSVINHKEAIEVLFKSIQSLKDALRIILTPNDLETGLDNNFKETPRKNQSPLADIFEEATADIQVATRYIDDLSKRIEF